MAGKFELKKSGNGQFLFHLKASNGQVILASEQYVERRGAVRGIESVKKKGPPANRHERKTAKDGPASLTRRASNGRTIGQSEMYNTAASMENGIESVKKNAPTAA